MSDEIKPASSARVVREAAATSVTALSPTLELAGERFDVSEEAGRVFVSHPQWSLTGSGRTVGEACTDLIHDARDLAISLLNEPDEALSTQARRLREFVVRLG